MTNGKQRFRIMSITTRDLLYVLSLLLLCSGCYSVDELEEDQSKYFLKTYGGVGEEGLNDMIVTEEGDFILVGYSTSYTNGGKDLYIIKTDSSGNQKWQNHFGGTYDDEAITVTTNGDNIIVAGYTSNESDETSVVVKVLTSDGTEQNELVYSIAGERLLPRGILHLSYGGYMVTGIVESSDYGFLLDVNENLAFRRDSVEILGSTNTYKGYYEGMQIYELSDEAKVLVLSTSGFTSNDPVNLQGNSFTLEEYFVDGIGLKGNGMSYGNSNNNYLQQSTKLSDNGYILCGNSINNGIDFPLVVKVKSESNDYEESWKNTFLENPNEIANAIVPSQDGGFIMVTTKEISNYGTDIGLVRLDAQGNILWQTMFGSELNDEGVKVFEASDGRIIIGSSIGYDIGSGEGESLKIGLIKVNKNGELNP